MFTKTEDESYDCPQYYCSKVLERGYEIFFVGYDLKPEPCGKIVRLDDEEALLIELYFRNAMFVRYEKLVMVQSNKVIFKRTSVARKLYKNDIVIGLSIQMEEC